MFSWKTSSHWCLAAGGERGSIRSPSIARSRRCRWPASIGSSTCRSRTASTAGLNRIYVLTQFNSVSLHRHIRRTYTFDAVQRRVRRNPRRPADARQLGLVSRHRRRRAAEPPLHPAVRHRLRAGPLGRPALSDELRRYAGNAPRLEGRRDDRRDAGHAARPRPHLASCGSTTRAASPAFSKSRRRGQELDMVRTDPAWIDAHGLPSHGRDLLASMGIYLFNRADARRSVDEDRLSRFRQGDFSGLDPRAQSAGAPVRRLLGRHRHDQVVLPVQSRSGGGQSSVRISRRPTPRFTPALDSCLRRGSTAPRFATA